MENSEIVEEMERELYNAAVRGDLHSFIIKRNNEIESGSDEYLLRQSFPQQNNILHLAIRREQYVLIKAAALMGLLPRTAMDKLINQRNYDGNTPLHVAAEVGNVPICKLFLHEYDYKTVADKAGPWRVENVQGNTPLHVALIYGNVEVAALLVQQYPHLARVINKSKETPLHLATYQDIDIPIKEGEEPTSAYLGLIKLLVEKESCVTCWRDANGLTPLHRAASITSTYNLPIIRLILEQCPQSAEVRDSSGMTILHLLKWIPSYKAGEELLKIPEIHDLKNYQDNQGNTPLHMAVKNQNLNLVRVLLASSAKLSIRNKDGISAAYLIQEQIQIIMEKREMTIEECRAIEMASIPYLTERLHKFGMNFLFSLDSKGRNIVHKLMNINRGTLIIQTDLVNFIEQVLDIFPALVCQVDINGDTPLHILVRNPFNTMIRIPASSTQQNNYNLSSLSTLELLPKLLELCRTYFQIAEAGVNVKGSHYDPPWLMQNVEGNTPLHEAFMADSDTNMVRTLLTLDIEITSKLLNKREQTPLHLLAGRSQEVEPLEREVIISLVKANEGAAFSLDKDGLTPFLRAVKIGNLSTIATLNALSPEATPMGDANNGETLWHLLLNHAAYSTWRLVRSDPYMRSLLVLQDNEGNTALHLAIERRLFQHAIYFLDSETSPKARQKWMMELLQIETKGGITPSDLIRSSLQVPENFEEFMKDEPTMIGIRSVWEVPTMQMTEYADTMGVTAALLTTITFTAAFTVPGGVVQDKGTPLLMKNAAFQIFLISDILAMCLSMMVLFCLLWVVACADKGKAVVLMDFSIILLLLSFYTTLLTFMAGLYATVFPSDPWIAIITLVLCSLLMVLMDKHLVMGCVVPFGRFVLLFGQKFLRYVRSPMKILDLIRPCCSTKLLHDCQ